MYEKVTKILDVSKERDVDISVARDMLIHEDRENMAEYESAFDYIKTYYKYITSCRVAGDDESIIKFCKLYEDGDKESIKKILEEFNK